ncbi:MAG: hypothetical protein M3Y80_05800 [Verrucomicrobiota bacterium]|nr:hypothetical protein [Verrucomicrobiota bacterium]
MKKRTLSFSLIVLGLAGFASNSSAQRLQVDPTGISVEQNRGGYDGRDQSDDRNGYAERSRYYDESNRVDRDRDRRLGFEVDRVNREVRQVREEIRGSSIGGNRHVRAMFHEVMIQADRMNAEFGRGRGGWELRRRLDEIRARLNGVRRELRRGSRR